MGILSRISKAVTSAGGHAIDKTQVLGATSHDVVNPNNPGNWSSVRTLSVLHQPGYLSDEEADIIKELAKDKVKGARNSVKAMKNLGKIEEADAEVHVAHKKYLGTVADNELKKLRSNAGLARKLHGQRPSYSHLDESVQRAEAVAEQRIAQLQQKIRESY